MFTADLKQEFEFLPDNKIQEIEKVRQKLLDTGLPCILILYGSYSRGEWKEKRGLWSGSKSDFDILAVTEYELDNKELRDKAMRMFQGSSTVVQVLPIYIADLNRHLRESQFFYSDIVNYGNMIFYDYHGMLDKPEYITNTRKRELTEEAFDKWFSLSKEHLDFALHGKNKFKQDNKHVHAQLSAFHFQQCVEHCYNTIGMVFVRHQPHEHRLGKIRWNAVHYAPEVNKAFPMDTQELRDLFNHLDKAYIGGRYYGKDVYEVTMKHLDYWQRECEKLCKITEKACQRVINKMIEREKRDS